MELEWIRCGLSKEKCMKHLEHFLGAFKHTATSQKYRYVKFQPEDPENMFVFKVFIDPPDWTRRKREQHLVVNVYKESTFWSTSSILGSVGGTLGLTIGFSC